MIQPQQDTYILSVLQYFQKCFGHNQPCKICNPCLFANKSTTIWVNMTVKSFLADLPPAPLDPWNSPERCSKMWQHKTQPMVCYFAATKRKKELLLLFFFLVVLLPHHVYTDIKAQVVLKIEPSMKRRKSRYLRYFLRNSYFLRWSQ